LAIPSALDFAVRDDNRLGGTPKRIAPPVAFGSICLAQLCGPRLRISSPPTVENCPGTESRRRIALVTRDAVPSISFKATFAP